MGKNISIKRIIIGDDEPVFTISVVSRLTKIPVWTLRSLDKENIVKPKKTKGKTRMYSKSDLERLNLIYNIMKNKRINIYGLKIIQGLDNILSKSKKIFDI